VAAIVLLTGGITFTWFASITIARHPGQTAQAFVTVVLAAILLAGLVFCVAVLPRRSGSPETGPAEAITTAPTAQVDHDR
jgi:hypothetical protein